MASAVPFTGENDYVVQAQEHKYQFMGLARHAQFISRTIFVQNNDVEKACRILNRILSKEDIFGQYRRTRYYEKPTQVRRRINFETCKAIYNEDMDRKIKFLLRKNRVDPFPGAT